MMPTSSTVSGAVGGDAPVGERARLARRRWRGGRGRGPCWCCRRRWLGACSFEVPSSRFELQKQMRGVLRSAQNDNRKTRMTKYSGFAEASGEDGVELAVVAGDEQEALGSSPAVVPV